MTFDIRVSLKAPTKHMMVDKTFYFSNEVDARDKADMVMMILDKNYFDTYDEYVKTIDAVSKVLQGYEYSIRPYSTKCYRI